ncbi:MAG TPA: L-threonylcarbamoyladenylate synthase [Burkholderiales bacterium]|nr:L-threonylcarbamoyladenylate synthase [Burkholderiales bacterium]
MAQLFTVHPVDPQPRLIRQAADIVRAGGVIAYPTDSCYALGCRIGDKGAMERIRRIRDVDERHHLTLVCRNLAEIAHYARLDNAPFRLVKASTPGSYTFILRAAREVPKRLMHPSRRTIGLRVPDHNVAQALLAELDEPLLSSTLHLPGDDTPLNDAQEIRERLEHAIDAVVDAGPCGIVPTTIIDLTTDVPVVVRVGKGALGALGLTELKSA